MDRECLRNGNGQSGDAREDRDGNVSFFFFFFFFDFSSCFLFFFLLSPPFFSHSSPFLFPVFKHHVPCFNA